MKRILLLFVTLMLMSSMVQATQLDADGKMKFDFADSSWVLSGGTGEVLHNVDGVSGAVLQIKGRNNKAALWTYNNFPFDQLREKSPFGLGMLRFKARTLDDGRGGMTGPQFSNKDFSFTKQWETYTVIFPISPTTKMSSIHLGQWNASSRFQFAEAEIMPVTVVTCEELLHSGEAFNTETGAYSFTSNFGDFGGSYSPKLQSWTTEFNSAHWNFFNGSELIYKFDAPNDKTFKKIFLEMNIGHYVSGKMIAQYSLDGKDWKRIAELNQAFATTGSADQFDAKTVWIRFLSDPTVKNNNLQLSWFRFVGDTKADAPVPTKDFTAKERYGRTLFWEYISGDAGFPTDFQVTLPDSKPGFSTYDKTVTWKDANGVEKTSVLRCTYCLHDYYRTDYGYRLKLDSVSTPIWWTNAMHKIPLTRAVPQECDVPQTKELSLSVAGNDYESAQLVIRPTVDTEVSATVTGDFKSEDGQSTIPASNVELRNVYYHFIAYPTDYTSVRDFWPDALPPIASQFTAVAGKNSPIWITVYVPEGTKAGTYHSSVTLKLTANGKTQSTAVPVAIHVWNFSLPKFNTIETAFGFHPTYAWQYHSVKTETDKRTVIDKYFRLLSRYRISPYNPVPLDPFNVTFIVDKENPANSRAEIDFTNFDKAFEKAIQDYHFTNYRLPIQGLNEPSILGYKENTPEYQAMFKSQVEQIQTHMKEKGWLDKCYVYWYDEPDWRHYNFVKNGMNRIKKYAPELPTMLTEEPSANTITTENLGKIDIWCPQSNNYNHERAEALKAKGARFWTYVCCCPRAPYCTEFTDHSAVELRTWLWQNWKYNNQGVLIWLTNLWTSPTAFLDPQHPQNPYQDPMSYVNGTAPGKKQFWGNGDGRFCYPPLSCQQPPSEPNFEDPVPSIRFEMLREGIEDFEMLQILKTKLAARTDLTPEQRQKYESLLVVPEEITSNWTTFNLSPDAIYQRRATIAEAIEDL